MKTRKILAVILVVLVLSAHTFAQNIGVAINSDGSAPNNSSILDVSSTTKGFAPPRMTHVQKLAIASPATGLIVWCTNCGFSGELQIFNGTTWVNTIGGVAAGVSPGAPTIGTATAGNAQATVTFTAPVSNGGSAITSYTATSSPGGLTGTLNQAGSGTITVTGLTNGTAYTFTVTATTVSGTSSPSAASNSVTPFGVPGAPTIGTATAGNAQATVTFTAPALNGGSAITSYTATSTPGGITGTLSQAGSGTITITGLTNGTAYTFSVKANNAAGAGVASAASNSVTYLDVPGAPTIGTATAADTYATITFTAPVSNGGLAITSYIATSSPGGFTGTLSQAGSGTITVTGLTNGTAYTFTVKANNTKGESAASAASNSITPSTPPVKDVNGTYYKTVKIGTQTWMAENLYTASYNDGTPIKNVSTPLNYWPVYTYGIWCYAYNNSRWYTTIGILYNWPVVDNTATKIASNGGKNICPVGWHVPNDAEWTTLFTYLGGETVAAAALKDPTTFSDLSTNSSGMTATAAGSRSDDGTFPPRDIASYWWSTTPSSATNANYILLNYNSSTVTRTQASKKCGFSVRCLKD